MVMDLKKELLKDIGSKLDYTTMPGAKPGPTVNEDEEQHTLTVERKNDDGEAESFPNKQLWSQVLKGTIADKLEDVPIKKSALTSDGKGFFSFPDRESRDAAAKTLKDDFIVVESDKKVRNILPKLKILDITGFKKDDKEMFKAKVLKKNGNIRRLVEQDKTFEVIYIHEATSETAMYGHCVIRVDPKIREEVIKNQRLVCIDESSFYAKDQVHVTQCFTCQQFGHKTKSPHCPQVSSGFLTCLYCSGNHRSKECSVKKDPTKHKCSNCSKSRLHQQQNNHTTTSFECPIYNGQLNNVIKRTVYDARNFPIQLTRPSFR